MIKTYSVGRCALLALCGALCTVACDSQRNAVEVPVASPASTSVAAVIDPSKQAIDDLMKAAQSGDVKAQANLGRKYIHGDGVKKDFDAAMIWISKAAQQGDVDSQFWMGWSLSSGIGLPQDKKAAIEWYKKAATAGHGRAQNALAYAYANGNDVQKDLVKAKEWYAKAFNTFSNEAAAGDPKASHSLATMYEFGTGVKKDLDEAIKWYEKAIALGDTSGNYSIGRILLEQGKTERAIPYLERSANLGDFSAQYKLASMYYRGEGVPKNSAIAAKWYQMASMHESPLAASPRLQLGFMHLEGDGVEKDYVLAYALFNLAAVHEPLAAKLRDSFKIAVSPQMAAEFEKKKFHFLTSEQKREAEELASNWKPGQLLSRADNQRSPEISNQIELKKSRTGTAFFVNKDGVAISNYHVVSDCKQIRIGNANGMVKLLAQDRSNDLALLQASESGSAVASIAPDSSKLRQGEDIVVFGFPLEGLLSTGGNLTHGVVSALTGIGNNTSQFQITAAIQPGSSGSPVLNRRGDVVGIVMMKLSDSAMVQATGQIAQNVNFAISGQTVRSFLEVNKVTYKTSNGLISFDKSNSDIADLARKSTTVVECWK